MTSLEKRMEEDARRRIAYDAKRQAMNIRTVVVTTPVKEVEEKSGKKVKRNIHKEMHVSVMK